MSWWPSGGPVRHVHACKEARAVTRVIELERQKDARRQGGIVLCSCCAYVTQVGKQCKLCGNLLTEERQQTCRDGLAQ